MVTNFPLLVMIVALMGQVEGTQCKANNQIPDIWAGTVGFSLPPAIDNTVAYTFDTFTLSTPRSYSSNSYFQFGFGLKEFSTSTSNILYFDLLVLKTYQSSIVINFIYEPNKWSKVVFNYWMGFRRDLVMGVETFTNQQFEASNSNGGIITSRVDSIQGSNTHCIAMVFIVGVRYNNQHPNTKHRLGVYLTNQSVASNILIVHFGTQSPLPIQSITISYLIYAPSLAQFGSYGGIVSQSQLKGSHHKNIHYLFPSHNFKALFGLSAFETSDASEKTADYKSSLSEDYFLQFSVKDWQLLQKVEISYIVAGVMPASICKENKECQQQGRVYIYQDECVGRCPAGTKTVTYIDRSVECQGCPPNQHHGTEGKCLCNHDFTMNKITGQCQKIQAKAVKAITHSKANHGDTLGAQPTNVIPNCLKMVGIQQSNKNVFVSLKASSELLLDKKSGESGFIKIDFPGISVPISYYCNQCPHDSSVFECLLLFATGLPPTLFSMDFSCEVETFSGLSECRLSVPYKSIEK